MFLLHNNMPDRQHYSAVKYQAIWETNQSWSFLPSTKACIIFVVAIGAIFLIAFQILVRSDVRTVLIEAAPSVHQLIFPGKTESILSLNTNVTHLINDTKRTVMDKFKHWNEFKISQKEIIKKEEHIITMSAYESIDEFNQKTATFDLSQETISSQFIDHIKTLSSIPKLIHISWNDRNVIEHFNHTKMIQNGIKNLRDLNPDWKFKIYNDSEVTLYIKSKLRENDFNLIKNKHIVEKVDLWRLLVIYFEGGYYQDIDKIYNIPFSTILNKSNNNGIDIKMLLPTYYNINFAQDIMCSAPFNNVFKYSIELNLLKRRLDFTKFENSMLKKGNGIKNETAINFWLNNSAGGQIYDLGPTTYWYGVTKALYGKILDARLQTDDNVMKMRQQIGQIAMIKTYSEKWCDSIVYQTDDIDACKRISREPLWQEINKKHWSQEVVKSL